MVRHVLEGKFDDACSGLKQLYDLGYSPTDIITTIFRIIKNYDMAEYLKLEFMKVCVTISSFHIVLSKSLRSFISEFVRAFSGNWVCSYEDLRRSWFVSSVMWSSG